MNNLPCPIREIKGNCHFNTTFSRTRLTVPKSASSFRIALVDDDEGIYIAFREIAKNENWLLEYYSDGHQAIEHIPFSRPNVVLMDIAMPGFSGIDCTQKLKCCVPDLPVVMLTAWSNFENILFSLMAGASGYMLKPFSLEQLKKVVFDVGRGNPALCVEAQKAMLTCFRRVSAAASTVTLSKRELEVMVCLIQNLSDKEISERLKIAPNTVHVYLVRLFRLLGVHNRKEAIRQFFRSWLAQP